MSEKKNIITIDGPSGVGKSTVSRKVAAAVGFTYLDTGAMYRAVGLHLSRLQIDLEDKGNLGRVLEALTLDLIPAAEEESDVQVIMNGEDVSEAIRTPEMAMVASRVSADAAVRQFLTQVQKNYGAAGRIVAEGRDTGTVVFPDAAYKFFLDAQPEERARRRVLQLQRKGCRVDFVEILAMTLERDHQDRNRAVAPLRPAEDAVLIDTTEIDIEEVVNRILAVVRGK
ncbi:MAG: cytidylate kinase [Desulfobacterales bacterium GWB2_56_26]|nr:MAG: cytidylate kinase [Desulfobacterales bacterium GWB2_56_26]